MASFSRSVMVSVMLVALSSAGAHAGSIVRSDNGKPVPVSKINSAVMGTGLIARLQPGESLKLYDISITADAPAAVMLSASSEYLTAAVLTGEIKSAGMQAKAGQLLTWPMDGKNPQRFYYDIGRLLASSSPAIDAKLRAEMDPALRSQERAMFWGKLQPAATNMRAPVSPGLEALRREYLQSTSAVETRRAASGSKDVASKEVADKFVNALIRRDSETVAELLDPVIFKANAPDDWMESRSRFAKKLTASSLPSRLKGYSLKGSGDMKWSVVADGKTYVMEQAGKGSFPFVKKFEAQ